MEAWSWVSSKRANSLKNMLNYLPFSHKVKYVRFSRSEIESRDTHLHVFLYIVFWLLCVWIGSSFTWLFFALNFFTITYYSIHCRISMKCYILKGTGAYLLMNVEEIDISAILSLSNTESLFRSFLSVYITFDRGVIHSYQCVSRKWMAFYNFCGWILKVTLLNYHQFVQMLYVNFLFRHLTQL